MKWKEYGTIQTDKEIQDSFAVCYHEQATVGMEDACRIVYNRIFLLSEAQGTLVVDDTTWPLKGNELFLLAKGQVFAFAPGSVITGYELSFGDCFWEKAPASASNCKAVLFNNAAANQQLSVHPADERELILLFQALLREYHLGDYINKPDALAAYLKIIMIKIANIQAALVSGTDSYESQLFRQFTGLVSKHYSSTHEVAAYADMLGVTARRLTDLCKQCGGRGAKDIINGQLIAEAKRALQFSAKAVKEIAFQLNFSTPDQFSHFFKKNTGVSANEFRERFVKIGR
ncbi:AraC-type DNA-binding protein [Filimonas lacunae]|uniref:AraC-type DNA-binding protein n=1 Tax=Filimonas lacunae TaxID=477680 RepID=A0A173MCZ9_9BACT|nr:AraC family transcriptional regulator [Filimonas lacunae]BAV05400.1 transcriptional regulator, AraC family [Filimonas lacunae]SIT21423.1 AraC-type DNA-binding protein [Filimonas lacunae]